jgi:hypothetical protein
MLMPGRYVVLLMTLLALLTPGGCVGSGPEPVERDPTQPARSEPDPASPLVLTWWVNIDRYYGLDQGGPQATAAARQAVLALREAGVAGLPIKTDLPDAQVDWMIRLADECRLNRVCILGWSSIFGYAPSTVARTWYGPGAPPGREAAEFEKSPYWVYDEVLHDGHGGCRTGNRVLRPLCHNYRGSRYDRLFRYVEQSVRRVRPDYVLVDHEIWAAPEEQEKSCPGVVARCSQCGSLGAAHRGWQEWVDRHLEIARAVNPKVKVYFYGTGQCWPETAGDGPSPPLYGLKAIAAGQSPDGVANALRAKNLHGGMPWLMFQPYKGYLWPTEQDAASWCRLLKRAGAKGFLVYCDLLPDERANRLIRAGVEAWREK